jgi:hypothetical protein
MFGSAVTQTSNEKKTARREPGENVSFQTMILRDEVQLREITKLHYFYKDLPN